MTGVGNFVRDNPAPVALIGAGLAWLMYSAARPRDAMDERFDRGPQTGLGQGAYGTAYARRDEARSGANGGGLAEKASRAAEAVGDAASDVVGGARSFAADAGERASGVFDAMTGRSREYGGYARGAWAGARDSYASMAAERPLMLGAIGFAAGAAIGLLLPSTRSENQMLGEYRDQLFEQAQTAGREQVQKAQTVANEAWRAARDTAKEEAAKQGFTAGSEEEKTGPGRSQADGPGIAAAPVV